MNVVLVIFSFQLLKINFIDSLTLTEIENKYILNVICYFIKKIISFVTFTVNFLNVIRCLKKMFFLFRELIVIYYDKEQHFNNSTIRFFLKKIKISIIYSFSKTLKSTEMMKMFNKLLKNVFKKKKEFWNENLKSFIHFVNFKVIEYLKLFFNNLLINRVIKLSTVFVTLLFLLERKIINWVTDLIKSLKHTRIVQAYLTHITNTHKYVKKVTRKQKKKIIIKYNRNVRTIIHIIKDFVMLH